MKKTHIVALATVVVLTTGVITATNVSAQTDSNTNRMSSLVQKLADKFGLNKDDVQAVFDEAHASREAEMETKYEERLTQLVSDGKITEDQKTLILAKHKDLEANRKAEMDSFKSMTADERKTAMDAKRTELENWAKENNIDVHYLMGMFHGKGHGHPGMDRSSGHMNN